MAANASVNVAIKGIELAIAVLQRVVAELRGPEPIGAPALQREQENPDNYLLSHDHVASRTVRIWLDDDDANVDVERWRVALRAARYQHPAAFLPMCGTRRGAE
jgi:hypothetical protein